MSRLQGYKGNAGYHTSQAAISLVVRLANEMNVKLYPTRPFYIVPDLVGDSSTSRPFFEVEGPFSGQSAPRLHPLWF